MGMASVSETGASRLGFTLIELLIVVAIIAILAPCATDHTSYPRAESVYVEYVCSLSTPVAYITSVDVLDPFTLDPRTTNCEARGCQGCSTKKRNLGF